MPKYYIPLMLVIEAQDYEHALGRSVEIVSSLCALGISALDGFADIDNVEGMEAPEDWFEEEVYVTTDGKSFTLTLEPF